MKTTLSTGMRGTILFASLFLYTFPIRLPALSLQPFGENNTLIITGRNEFKFADGYNTTREVPKPWNYLVNTTDFSITAWRLSFRSRFDIEEPSIGFNPVEPVHREYFSRRTLGVLLDKLTIEAGHVGTQFGRGLTLSCKEDREIEQYSLIDGVYGTFRNTWMTLQGIAGRPYHLLNLPQSLLSFSSRSWGAQDTILVQTSPDLQQRDMITGLYSEFFLPVDKFAIPVITSGSLGGGVVRYAHNVGALDYAYHDTTLFWYRPRNIFWLPSAALHIAADDFGVSVENSWLTGSKFYPDTSGPREARDGIPMSRSTYISTNGAIGNFSLLAEYKSYYYDRSNVYLKGIDGYFIPPAVRYQHSWHLLNKHVPSNLMGNELAYKFLLNWSPFEAALITADATYGGRHKPQRQGTLQPAEPYWEIYTEWQQEINERISAKVGLDYGLIDPDPPNEEVTFRTLAGMMEAGPYRERHSFKVTLESQLNSKPVLAEKNIDDLKQLIIDIENPDTTSENWVELATSLIPASYRTTHTQYVFNILATLEYSFKHRFSISVTFEHESLPDERKNVMLISEITATKRDFLSVGVRVEPIDGTTITGEYGSMSGGKKCTLGTCVDLPPFEGFKLTIESVF